MRVLLIKMSSMGDVFHTFPALTDAMGKIPNLMVDWVVEKSFEEIPSWHPAVTNVYSIELRKWRKHPFKYRNQVKQFFKQINQNQYDLVIDAQGLLKSAWVVKKIRTGYSVGFSWKTAREPLASLLYQKNIVVPKNQHAVQRLRELFSKVFGYEFDTESIDYGLDTEGWQVLPEISQRFENFPYVVLLHGTTWDTKLWPENDWIGLAKKLIETGCRLVLPWGNEEEKARAEKIASVFEEHQVWVPDSRLTLNEVARLLKYAKGIVSVDTGLSHVAAALNTPMVVLYRVTDPKLVGALGNHVRFLKSPCSEHYLKAFKSSEQERLSLENLKPESVFEAIRMKL